MNLFDEERKCKPILGFFGEYRFLSNYHICKCIVHDIEFKSSEHAYMFQKSFDPVYRQAIHDAPTPKGAKKLGSFVELRPDWNEYRKVAMFDALKAKFKNEDLKELLLNTGDAYLEETNTWGDTYWGVCKGVGENNLGNMLMRIRDSML